MTSLEASLSAFLAVPHEVRRAASKIRKRYFFISFIILISHHAISKDMLQAECEQQIYSSSKSREATEAALIVSMRARLSA